MFFNYDTIGSTTDPNNKMDVVMKLMKTDPDPDLELTDSLTFKDEIRVYKDLKRGWLFNALMQITHTISSIYFFK